MRNPYKLQEAENIKVAEFKDNLRCVKMLQMQKE